MAKFCTHCGRPLQEGEVCGCQQNAGNVTTQQPEPQPQYNQAPQFNQAQPNFGPQQNYGQQQSYGPQQGYAPQPNYGQPYYGSQQGYAPQQPSQFGIFLKNAFGLIPKLFTKPVETLKEVGEKADYRPGILFLGIQVIFVSLFIWLFYDHLTHGYGVSFTLFLKGLLFMIVQSAVLFGALFGMGKAFKGEGSFVSFFSVFGVASVYATCIFILNIILMFASNTLAAALNSFTLVISVPIGFIMIRDTLKVKENNSIFAVAISFLAYLIILFALLAKIIDLPLVLSA